MNRSFRDSIIGSRNLSLASQHRRGYSLNGGPVSLSKDSSDDNNLDLFSKSRRSLSVASSDESDVSVKLGRLSVGSTKQVKNGLDDLLLSSEGGKHDYDWLLTPPGTPLLSSSDGNESKPAAMAPRNGSLARSVSTTKTSRLSVSQSSESINRPRPTRSSSVTRSSVSTMQYSSYSNKSSNILNTSSASVSSYIRPSTPTSRSSSIARSSTPSSRPSLSRSSTPSRTRSSSSPSPSSADKARPSQNSRPSTPISRPQISANLNSPAARSTSRPSTPTRRNSGPSLSSSHGLSTSVGRALPNGRSAASTSRPSSPSSRVRSSPQPIVLPDFPLETPPNLRTSLPDRPLSAGRSRPGTAVTVKGGNVENSGPISLTRRQSSPVVTRGRLSEPSSRGRMLSNNGHTNHTTDSQRTPHVSELSNRRPVKASTESTGFGRSISKKSLDMAIRHMDIKNSNGIRPLTGSTLFPQSIRSGNTKGQVSPTLRGHYSPVNGEMPLYHNGAASEYGNYNNNNNNNNRLSENGNEEDVRLSAKVTEVVDIYESSRYDTILLKEDLKNTNWLHSVDDKSEQGAIFDNGFETLPEPFYPL